MKGREITPVGFINLEKSEEVSSINSVISEDSVSSNADAENERPMPASAYLVLRM